MTKAWSAGGDLAGCATGGRSSEQVDQGQVVADERLGSGGGNAPTTEEPPA